MTEGKPERRSRADLLTARANLQALENAGDRIAAMPGVNSAIGVALAGVADALLALANYTMHTANGERSLIEALPSDASDYFIDLANDAKSLGEAILIGDIHDPVGSTGELLERSAQFFRALTDSKGTQFAREAIENRLVNILSLQSNYRLAIRTEGVLEQAVEAASAAAESAGDRAEQSLSTEFDDLAKKQGRAANIFRGLTIALFLIVIGYAAAVALDAEKPSVEVGQKLAVGIPVLLLAGYFSREASHHRKTARWASVLGAQLRSVRAYTVSMEADSAEELRLALGRRAFLESPDTQPATPEDGATASLDPSVVREITELVRASRQP